MAEIYASPVDNELGAVGIWKKDTDQLLGCLINFSCHACINLEGATADRGSCSTLRCLTKQLVLKRKINNCSSEEEIAECWNIVRNTPDSPLALRAKSRLVGNFKKCNSPKEPVEKLKVLQIGPLVIGSSSGEMFAQYALDFKAASAFCVYLVFTAFQ